MARRKIRDAKRFKRALMRKYEEVETSGAVAAYSGRINVFGNRPFIPTYQFPTGDERAKPKIVDE
jgi:hypothetical protein